MGQFSQEAISPEAQSLGKSLEIIAEMIKIQQDTNQIIEKNLQTQGEAAKGIGQAIESATIQESRTMEDNADGMFASGISMAVAEGVSLIHTYAIAPIALGNANRQLQNVKAFEQKIQNVESGNKGSLEIVNDNERLRTVDQVKQKLSRIDLKEIEADDAAEDDLACLKTNDEKAYSSFKRRVTREKRDALENLKNAETKYQQRSQTFSNYGNIIGTTIQGHLQQEAAAEKNAQAAYELMRQIGQYCYDTYNSATANDQKAVDSLSSNTQQALQTLLAGLAAANSPAA